jgi:hypothetical protein
MPYLDYSRLGTPLDTNDKNELRFNCVYCDDEGYHLYINVKKKVFFCQKCNTSGKTNLVSKDFELAHYTSILKKERPQQIIPIKLPTAYRDPVTGEQLTPSAKRYLANRGIFESDVKRHTMYCATPNSFYFGRIIIPNNPYMGYCNYFVARAYTKLRWPKYLNPSSGKQVPFLSPKEPSDKWDQYWEEDEVMLVEGPFDYLKASRHGPTIALLGKQLPYAIAKQIVSMFRMVHVMLDQGLPENIAALEIVKLLQPHVDVVAIPCPKKDPGEMGPEEFKRIMQ